MSQLNKAPFLGTFLRSMFLIYYLNLIVAY